MMLYSRATTHSPVLRVSPVNESLLLWSYHPANVLGLTHSSVIDWKLPSSLGYFFNPCSAVFICCFVSHISIHI